MSGRILIIGPNWIGDMVMAQSLFMTLKREYPGKAIDVVAPGWSGPLLARMPEVEQSILTDLTHGSLDLAARWSLATSLREARYEAAIVLPNSLKSALVPWLARIPKRTGWRGEMRYGLLNDIRLLDRAALPMMVDRFNALAFEPSRIRRADDFPSPHPRPRLQTDEAIVGCALQRFELTRNAPVLALCPGAEFGPSKQWPASSYAQLARTTIARGWQVWLFGSAKDRAVCEAISAQLDDVAADRLRMLAGHTTLEEAIDLLSVASAVVTNDSGLMHVAAALERPLVAIYGSTSPDFTPPLNETARIARLGLSCSPCFARVCPLGHTNCLHQLLPQKVIHELELLTPAR